MCNETKLQLAKEIVLFSQTLTAVEWKRSVFREKKKISFRTRNVELRLLNASWMSVLQKVLFNKRWRSCGNCCAWFLVTDFAYYLSSTLSFTVANRQKHTNTLNTLFLSVCAITTRRTDLQKIEIREKKQHTTQRFLCSLAPRSVFVLSLSWC